MRGHERGARRVLGDRGQLGRREIERGGRRAIVLADVAAEVRRVIRVDRHDHALAQELGEVVLGEILDHAQLQVRQRTHRERNAIAHEALDERGVFVAAHAVIDAVHVQDVEGFRDVRGRAFLSRMRDQAQIHRVRLREHAGELRRRIAALAGVEPDADDVTAKRHRGVERRERRLLGEVAEEAQDQVRGHAVATMRVVHRVAQPRDHDLHRDAAIGVRLRIEEQLGVDDVVRVRACEVRHRERVEVAAIAEDGAARVIEIEERLEVVEVVGGADRLDRGVRQRHAVLAGEGEHHLGLERAFDMEVQLDLRKLLDQPRARGIEGLQRHRGGIQQIEPVDRPPGGVADGKLVAERPSATVLVQPK